MATTSMSLSEVLKMCYPVECRECKKTTWNGCGFHVTSALEGIPEEKRCPFWKKGKHPNRKGEFSLEIPSFIKIVAVIALVGVLVVVKR